MTVTRTTYYDGSLYLGSRVGAFLLLSKVPFILIYAHTCVHAYVCARVVVCAHTRVPACVFVCLDKSNICVCNSAYANDGTGQDT